MWSSLRRELPAMLRLAVPLVAAELGWMCMGLVDTMMVGRMRNSADAIGAVGLGSILFFTVAIVGMGILWGLDTLVAQAFGAGRIEDCHRALWSGVYLCLPLSALSLGVVKLWPWILTVVHTNAEILPLAIAYLKTVSWCAPPLLLFFAFRRYLQAMNLIAPVTFALVTANVVNLAGNWILIHGRFGFPAMGVVGSAWATVIARTYLWLVVFVYAIYYDRRHNTHMFRALGWPDWPCIRTLLKLGLPAAGQMVAEVGVFATSTALIGQLDAVSLAGNQIAMNVISLTFMVPLGISGAAAVRVGQAIGARDGEGAARAGWTALALGAAFMSCSAVALLLFPQYVVRAYTSDPVVIAVGAQLLIAGAFFQIFDALQAITIGALRGAGNTHTGMIVHLLIYWGLGLPLGYWLCFTIGWGAMGMWAGLSLAVILIGIVLFLFWNRKVRELKMILA
jgi:MATE family multidrug resistance protein